MLKLVKTIGAVLLSAWVVAVSSALLGTVFNLLIGSYLVEGIRNIITYFAQNAVMNFFYSLILVVFFLLLYIVYRLILSKPFRFGYRLIAFCLGPTTVFLVVSIFALPINEKLLPLFFTPTSLAVNGLIFVCVIIVSALLMLRGKALLKNFDRAWVRISGYICSGLTVIVTIIGIALPATPDRLPYQEPTDGPNVIIITIDAYRQDRMSAYGNYRDGETITPNLDEFAEISTRFETACTHSPWTIPSMYTMHSSRYPSVHGTHFFRKGNTNIAMLAEVLKSRGYHTEAIIANPLMYSELGFDKGFIRYLEYGDIEILRHFKKASLYRLSKKSIEKAMSKLNIGGTRPTTWITNRITSSLSRKRNKPLFLWAHYIDPHIPLLPPRKFVEGDAEFIDEALTFAKLHNDKSEFVKANADKIIPLYDGEVRYVDNELERVFTKLEEEGYLTDSIIIITSDHGDEHFEFGHYGHSTSHRDKVISIPLLIYIPGVEGGVCEQPAGLIDIAPTVLDYIGINERPYYSGDSLLPYILEGAKPNSDRYIFIDQTMENLERKSVRSGDYMLSKNDGDETSYEMVNLPEDGPLNYVIEKPDSGLLKRYKEALNAWIEETESESVELGEENVEIEINEDHKSKLKDLGYM
ncbi:MAG: sulfatase-like hydrolase/transferase [bacterium]|nr:sulfatase-like hydrolase/transferase [bacterium]